MKEIILVRHAKSDWPPGVNDIDRKLSPRGIADCKRAIEYFDSLSNIEDFEVHVSVATRTQETWRNIQVGIATDLVQIDSSEIYEASLGELLDYLAKLDHGKLILVGHNPGMARLGSFLTAEEIGNFPSLSIWHIETGNDLQPGSGRTKKRLVPRANPANPDSD